MTTLYSCKAEIDHDGTSHFRITKFDAEMNVESSYRLSGTACECPAGERSSCRHRQMLPKFLARGAVNTHWLLDFDRDGWVSAHMHHEFEQEMSEREAEQDVEISYHKTLPEDSTSEQVAEAFANLAESILPVRTTFFKDPHKLNRRGF